jgi:hypothetical protein
VSVVDAVTRDLSKLGGDAKDSALAASALALAAELDDSENSATSKSMCARALLDTLDRLRELAPPKREADSIDEIGARRAERRRSAGGPAAADLPRP